MGVAISKLIPRKQIEIADLAGKQIALDAFNTIYYFLSVIRNRMTGEPLKDHKGAVTSHLSGLLYRTLQYLEAGVKPAYVFDGHFPDFKKRTIEKRRLARATATRKWHEAVRRGRPAFKYAQAASKMNVGIVESSKALLDLLGTPWIQAPSEGEAQCAWMCQQGVVFAAASQDLDSLLFGAPRLVRNLSAVPREGSDRAQLFAELGAGGIDPELIELDYVLKSLELTREQLIIVALLVGTDYNEGIRGIGPKRALALVKEHGALDVVQTKVHFPVAADIRKIYEFFLNPPHTADFQLAWRPAAFDKLGEFLVGEHDFSPQRVEKATERLRAVWSRKSE